MNFIQELHCKHLIFKNYELHEVVKVVLTISKIKLSVEALERHRNY